MTKPTLVLDFDGVVHSNTSGWADPTVIPDPPVDGAIEFIIAASDHFTVVIFSSRSDEPGGREAMFEWLKDHWIDYGFTEPQPWEKFNAIEWPTAKPAAFLTIGDRYICFDGSWPDPVSLLAFKPWRPPG